MATWLMESRNQDGDLLATKLPFKNLQGEWFLGKPDQIRFELPLHHHTMSFNRGYPALTEIWLWRNNTLVFAGPLWDYVLSSEEEHVSCGAQSLESYFELRRVGTYKANKDTEDILWDLVAATQAEIDGDLRIVRGANEATFTQKVDFHKNQGLILWNVIDDMANQNPGFDWEILPGTRELKIYYPKRQDLARVNLEYRKNVKKYTMMIMGKYMRNDILVLGEGMYTGAIDGASRTTYGLRQHTETFLEATNVPTLQARAQLVRQDRREPKFVAYVVCDGSKIDPFGGDIQIGQKTVLTIQDGPLNYNVEERITGWQLSLGKQLNETYVFYLNDLREVEEE